MGAVTEPGFEKDIYDEVVTALLPEADTSTWDASHTFYLEKLTELTNLVQLNKLIESEGVPKITSNAKRDKISSIIEWLRGAMPEKGD